MDGRSEGKEMSKRTDADGRGREGQLGLAAVPPTPPEITVSVASVIGIMIFAREREGGEGERRGGRERVRGS